MGRAAKLLDHRINFVLVIHIELGQSYDTYRLGCVLVAHALTIKNEADAILWLAHALGIRAFQLRKLGRALDFEEHLVSLSIFHLDIQLLRRHLRLGHCLLRHDRGSHTRQAPASGAARVADAHVTF